METRKTRNGTKYREMIYINGKARKSPFFSRKTDAKTWKNEKQREKELLLLNPQKARLFTNKKLDEYVSNWIETTVKLTRTPSTIQNYSSQWEKHLKPSLGHLSLRDIQGHHVDRLCLNLKECGHNAKGINLIIGLLKTILNDAVKNEYLIKSPLANYPKIPEDPLEYDFWTKADMDKFLSANLQSDYYPLYLIALYTGMRRGELAGLCWDRVNLAQNQIVVSRTRDRYGLRDTTKSKRIRYIPIHPLVRSVLLKLFKQQRNQKFVLTEDNGQPIRVQHLYRRFKKDQSLVLGLSEIRFHDLRHTYASQFVMNGGNVFDLQKILGHSDIKMTMRYAHHSAEHLQSTIKFFGFGANEPEFLDRTNPILTPEAKLGTNQFNVLSINNG